MSGLLTELLDELTNRRDFTWNVPDWLDLDGLIAALERAERVEAALRELVRRAGDPDIRIASRSFGAWHMLYKATAEAREVLGLPALEAPDGR